MRKPFISILLIFFLSVLFLCGPLQRKTSTVTAFRAAVDESGAESATAQYRELFLLARDEHIQSELIGYGRSLLESDRVKDAVSVFEMLRGMFPESWRVWDALGAVYHDRGGMFNEAVTAFQKSLSLKPEGPETSCASRRLAGLQRSFRAETDTSSRFTAGARTGLTGPYLGQEPPGDEPVLFAPGIVSTAGAFEYALTVTGDGREITFSRGSDLFVCREESGYWRAPEKPAYVRTHPGHEMQLSPDGCTALYVRKGEQGPEIWSMERRDGEWTLPSFLCEGMFASMSLDRRLYVTGFPEGDGGDLFHARFRSDGYPELIPMGSGVNTPYAEMHPSVAPDGSYLVFDSTRPGGEGWADLYVTFPGKDGQWNRVERIDGLSTPGNDLIPSVSPDGKYLFFSMNNDIYWVSTDIIEEFN